MEFFLVLVSTMVVKTNWKTIFFWFWQKGQTKPWDKLVNYFWDSVLQIRWFCQNLLTSGRQELYFELSQFFLFLHNFCATILVTRKGIVNFRVTDDSILNVNIKFLISQSSHPEVFLENGVIKISGKFTEEHLCRSVISIKLLCDLLHIFRTAFTKNTSGWLLLYQRHISENTILLHIISKKCSRNECIFTGTPCKNQLLFSGFKRYFV